MKKLLSVIIALSMCASVTTLSATTASAATVETQAVSAYVAPSLETELDKMSASDTVAVDVVLSTESFEENVDIVGFAKENGLEDQIEVDENGMLVDYTAEFMRAFLDYMLSSTFNEYDKQYNIIKDNYCESVLYYDRQNACVFCISTKSQVEAMTDLDFVVGIGLRDKEYISAKDGVTWEKFYKMNDDVRAAYSQLKGVDCTADMYDITFEDSFGETGYIVIVSEHEINFTTPILERMDDVVWINNVVDSYMYIYENGSIYTAGEMYKQNKIDFETFQDMGGRYYGDVNSDEIVDVNDVTGLQLYLANNDYDPILDILTGYESVYCDINLDSYVDVNDVTTLQMYLAGYEV